MISGFNPTFQNIRKGKLVHRSREIQKNQREILIHLTDTAYNRLVKHPPRYHVAVKEQMSRIFDCSRTRAIFLPAGQISIWH